MVLNMFVSSELSKYEQAIKLFIENDSVKKKQYLFMKITNEVKLYHENNWLKNLDGVEFDEKFQSAKIAFVSLSRVDSVKYEYSWFNSKLSEENKSLEELIDEAAAPQ